MEPLARITGVVLIIAATLFGIAVGLRLARRHLIRRAWERAQAARGARGERPVVILHVDGIQYDLSETGVIIDHDDHGNLLWEFYGGAHLIASPTIRSTFVTIPQLPVGTNVSVRIGDRLWPAE